MDIKDIRRDAIKILKDLHGEDAEFRPGQYESIEATLTNKRSLIVQKTGWGKSLVYFTATKLLRNAGRGTTIVISPLLSLMENQKEAAIKLDLQCEMFNSELKDELRVNAINNLKTDFYDLIFVTPETLFKPDVNNALRECRIGLFVIDEAHCISDWGNDFRLDYSDLYKIIRAMPMDVPVLATTATANDRVVEDIRAQFGDNMFVSRGPLTRESLAIQVVKLKDRADRYAWLKKNLRNLPGVGIIYCLTHSDCDRLSEFLVQNGIKAMPYYSGEGDNSLALEAFKNNQIKVIVATVKLGMGYDKGDIGFVVHFQMPSNIVSYYQQIGRAGRNIDIAYAILMCGEEDDDIHEYFINEAFPTQDECYGVVKLLKDSNGLSSSNIELNMNISHARLEKTLSFLMHEEVIYYDDKKYYLSAQYQKEYVYNKNHYDEITKQRKTEYLQMKELVETKICYSKFVVNCLDDFSAHDCGKCANCIHRDLISSTLDLNDKESALAYLNSLTMPIEPRKHWSDCSITGKMKIDKLNDIGICLSKYNDTGYGELVKKGKYGTNGFDSQLVARSAELLKPILTDKKIKHICCVPSLRSDLVRQFTIQLAQALKIDFVDCLIKNPAAPQKSMQNKAFQCRNAWNSFSVADCNIPTNLVLVDDIIDSKWTMTVCGYKLMDRGAQLVFPFALADSSRR